MTRYTPDVWKIIRITSSEGVVDRVLAGWYGGYTSGDCWKINSGVTHTEEYEDRYEFAGWSGSVYVCYKNSERLSGMTSSVLQSLISSAESLPDTTIEVLDYTKIQEKK